MNSNTKGQLWCLIAAFVMLVLGADWFVHVHNSLAPTPSRGWDGNRRHRGDGRKFRELPEKVALESDGLPWGAHQGDGSLSWLTSCGWFDKKWDSAFGMKTAMAPKTLKLAWNENSVARRHDIYEAFSPVPFLPGKENFVKIASIKDGDHLPSEFQTREYNKLGYYHFKIVPVFFEGRIQGPATSILELVLVKKRPLAGLSPLWVDQPCWNSAERKDAAGPTSASAPQRLWLDWLDVEGAANYRVYSAYSAAPFQSGKENFQLMLTTKISAYHSGDPRFLTGAPLTYTHPGYYRFKVMAVSAAGIQSKPSEVRELVLR